MVLVLVTKVLVNITATGFKSGEFGGQRSDGMKSGISFFNISTVVQARCAVGQCVAEMCSHSQKHDEYLVAKHLTKDSTAIIFPVDFDSWFQKVDVTAAKIRHFDSRHHLLTGRWSGTQQPVSLKLSSSTASFRICICVSSHLFDVAHFPSFVT